MTKATLSSGKQVVLRKLTVGLRRQAVEAAGKTAGTNQALLGLDTQDEMIKILLHSIDGKKVNRAELETTMDDQFSMDEYNELMLVLEDVAGTQVKKPKLEMVTL